MQSIGHPLVGDAKYNNRNRASKQGEWCERLFLHAHRIEFEGLDGAVDVTVALAPDLKKVFEDMRQPTENSTKLQVVE
jgi:23S rRNA-/tRNA-specific pseudouridylate synthase